MTIVMILAWTTDYPCLYIYTAALEKTRLPSPLQSIDVGRLVYDEGIPEAHEKSIRKLGIIEAE